MHIPMRIHVPKELQKRLLAAGFTYVCVNNLLLRSQNKDLKKSVRVVRSGYDIVSRSLDRAYDDLPDDQLAPIKQVFKDELAFQKVINPDFKLKD